MKRMFELGEIEIRLTFELRDLADPEYRYDRATVGDSTSQKHRGLREVDKLDETVDRLNEGKMERIDELLREKNAAETRRDQLLDNVQDFVDLTKQVVSTVETPQLASNEENALSQWSENSEAMIRDMYAWARNRQLLQSSSSAFQKRRLTQELDKLQKKHGSSLKLWDDFIENRMKIYGLIRRKAGISADEWSVFLEFDSDDPKPRATSRY